VSVEAAVARVQQIQQMLGQASGADPISTTSSTGTSFQAQLQQATAADATTGATATQSGGPVDGQYSDLINAAAQKYGIDPALLKGLIRQESNFNPNAQSGAGAQGLCQLMPGTAASLGCTNPLDPAQAIDAGAKYLSQQLKAFGGDPRKALAAYNAGPGAVQRSGGVPPYAETQNYVRSVMAFADQYRTQSPQSPQTSPTAGVAAGSLPYSTV
jgi:soluble lytic murein transglycosylase-like protein